MNNTEAEDKLLDAAHRLAALGLSPGSSGNVSVRIGDRIHVSATGSSLADLSRADLSVLDLQGHRVQGPIPTKEASLHMAFYARSPEISCVVHLHSPATVAVSCLPPHSDRSALPPITPYFVMRVGQTPLLPYAHPGSPDHANHLATIDFQFRAALLRNHGAVVAGSQVSQAETAAIELEQAAAVILRLPAGRYRTLSEGQAQALAEQYGSYWGA